MSTGPSRAWTKASIAQVRQRLQSRAESAAAIISSEDSPYHEAAAVLAWFELDPPLQPAGRNSTVEPAMLEQLVTDSICWYDDGTHRRWTLKNDVRKQVLARMATRERIIEALQANASRPQDTLQRIFEGYMRGSPVPLASQNRDELSATLQVIDWLPEQLLEQMKLPAADEVRRRIEQASLLATFSDLAPAERFKGRKTELATLQDYVEVLEPSSTAARIRQGLRNIFSLKEKPPMMIYGPGGMGKSTLLAKFILDHTAGAGPQLPFVYLDCDRPGLIPEEPITLLIEAVRQLGIQYPKVGRASRAWIDDWQKQLAIPEGDFSGAAGLRSRTSRERRSFLDAFGAFVADLALVDSPLLLVIDTFEEVQYRGQAYIEELWNFMEELQGFVPRLRTVIAGRAPLRNFSVEHLPLNRLDEESAVALLEAEGVTDKAVSAVVARQLRGNPLSLRLAARVLRFETADKGGIQDLEIGWFWSKVDDSIIQGQLYRRILSHVRDEDVRKLVHPGLILRTITGDLIKEVLAGPCGVDVSQPGRAEQLLDALRKEISLVTTGSGPEAEVRHRPEVRRVMLDLLRKDEREKVERIERQAVEYYQQHSPQNPASRAEEIYHRLGLGQDSATIASRWMSGIEDFLRNAIEDFSGPSQTLLASLLGIELDQELQSDVPLEQWEAFAQKRAEDLLALNRPAEALEILRQRSARTPKSTLYLLESRALMETGRLREARQVAQQAVEHAYNSAVRLRVFVMIAHIDELLGSQFSPQQMVAEYFRLSRDCAGDSGLVELAIYWIRVLLQMKSEGILSADEALTRLQMELVLVLAKTSDTAIREQKEVFQSVIPLVADQKAVQRLQAILEDGTGKSAATESRRQSANAGLSVRSELTAEQQQKLVMELTSLVPNRSELALIVRRAFGIDLRNIVNISTSMEAVITDLLLWVTRSNRLGELLYVLSVEFPNSPYVKELTRQLGALQYAPANPAASILVSGARPFLGRPVLRRFLRDIGDPSGSRILVITGPAGSGKTYSASLMQYVASETGNFDMASLSLGEMKAPSPQFLVRSLAAQMNWSTNSIAKYWGRLKNDELASWVLTQCARRTKTLLIVIDDIEPFLPGATIEFIGELALAVLRTSSPNIKLVLLGQRRPAIPAGIDPRILFEDIQPFTKADIMEFFDHLAFTAGMDETVHELVAKFVADLPSGPINQIRLNQRLGDFIKYVLSDRK